MPRSTIRIVDAQRDALYKQVRNHLAAFGDLWLALETNGDYAAAERLGIEFGEDFRLMADLGWNPEDGRNLVELTMAPEDLTEVIRRLRDEAIGGLHGGDEEHRARLELEQQAKAFADARDVCEDILEVLADRSGGEIRVSRA